MKMSIGAYNKIIKLKPAVTNKYHNKITEYGGRKYHSKKEAEYAMQLDMLKTAQNASQRVLEWEPQVRYKLVVNDVLVATYVLDFRVLYADQRTEYVDVKGVRTDVYTMKKKLMLACHGIAITEV